MKRVIGGRGKDTTAAVIAWLQANNPLWIKHLYLIGDADHPQAAFLTDYEAPLLWPMVGTFRPAVITRGPVKSKIGLESEPLQIDWSPKPQTAGTTIQSATPYQLAKAGFYDNWPVRVWTVYMPTPGDAMTFGCSPLFGGPIATVTVNRGKLTFKVNSFLNIVNQTVPTNVIEILNTEAAYQGATPPQGFSEVPRFVVVEGSSNNVVVGFQTSPNPGGILHTNSVRGGFLVFDTIPDDTTQNPPVIGSTLGGIWSAIQQNTNVLTGGSAGGGGQWNQFVLFSNLPFPPQSNHDSFYVSGTSPINKADSIDGTGYYGFPYIPNPEQAL